MVMVFVLKEVYVHVALGILVSSASQVMSDFI